MNYKKFLIISISLYIVSIFTPIFSGSDFPGGAGLFLGIIGVFEEDVYHALPWFANILYFANLIIGKRRAKVGIFISGLTLVLGAFTIGIKEVPVHEGGLKEPVTIGMGFSLWMFSFITLLIGQLLNLDKSNQ